MPMDDYLQQMDENRRDKEKYQQRMREDWDNLMDELIQEGREKGLFDNLSGQGKPLLLEQSSVPTGQELANAILKENDVAPAWIMERNDILARRDKLRADIQRQWLWHEAAFADAGENRGRLTISWDDCCLRWQEEILLINQRIDTYNLKRPSERLELFKLELTRELDRAAATRWLR
jgi:hypothetical protein